MDKTQRPTKSRWGFATYPKSLAKNPFFFGFSPPSSAKIRGSRSAYSSGGRALFCSMCRGRVSSNSVAASAPQCCSSFSLAPFRSVFRCRRLWASLSAAVPSAASAVPDGPAPAQCPVAAVRKSSLPDGAAASGWASP